jgi:membrane protein implicated in regulation of membrane protease activity
MCDQLMNVAKGILFAMLFVSIATIVLLWNGMWGALFNVFLVLFAWTIRRWQKRRERERLLAAHRACCPYLFR